MSIPDPGPAPHQRGARPPRAVALVGAAAVVALAAATAFVVGTRSNDPEPSGSAAAPRAAAATSSAATPAALDTDNVLGVAYLQGSTFHLVDGRVLELPTNRMGYAQAWQIGDDVLAVTAAGPTGRRILRVDASGARVATYRAASDVVVDDARTGVAWITAKDRLRVVSADGGKVLARNVSHDAVVPTAMSGAAQCVSGGGGCHVYADLNADPNGVQFDADGERDRLPGDAARVNAADADGLVSALTQSGARGPCGYLSDITDGGYRLLRCDLSLRQIAPGGGYVAGLEISDTARYPAIEILRPTEATRGQGIRAVEAGLHAAVNRFSPKRGYITSMAWQDAEHLMVAVHVEAGSKVVRLGVDGSRTLVAGPAEEGGEARTEFILGARVG